MSLLQFRPASGLILGIVVLGLTAGISACGGGGGSSSTPTPEPVTPSLPATYYGYVHTDRSGSTAAPNTTIVIHDASGDITIVSDSTGYFTTTEGNPANGYTATVGSMNMWVKQTNGSCDSCHGVSTGHLY